MAKIISRGFAQMLIDAGIITAERMMNVKRIVIDIDADSVPMLYFQEYGDSEALEKLAPMLKGMIPDGKE